MKQILLVILVIGMAATASISQNRPAGEVGHTLHQGHAAPAGQPLVEMPDEFIIGAEDKLQISVWREPELSAMVSVRPDGKIGVPLLNDVQASGRTTKQLQEGITEGLSQFVAEPHVSVIVVEINSRQVHIIGSVGRPGAYPLGGPMSVVELLARAGGLADFAKKDQIRIVRREGNTSLQFEFNYDDFVDGKDFQQNITLRSGDVVVVP
jgi:polysaccharide export outer membrane protein